MNEEERVEGAAGGNDEAAGGGNQEAARLLREYERQILALPVREHIERMLTSLSGLALQRLGLGEDNAGTYEPMEAGLAIEAFRALSEVLARNEPQLAGVYRSTLAQMQLAYASVARSRPAQTGEVQEEADEAVGEREE